MNSGELLRLQLANKLICARQQSCMGATGPAGGSGTIPGALKAFTIYVDFSAANAVSRVYIPPNLFADSNPVLAAGGTFIGNVGTDLVFLGQPYIKLNNTRYAFPAGLSGNGYIAAGVWQIVPPANIRPATGYLNYTSTADYSTTIGIDLNSLNGANLTVYPTTGAASGFLATVTVFYV
jgi:hypothetical protein